MLQIKLHLHISNFQQIEINELPNQTPFKNHPLIINAVGPGERPRGASE